MDLDLAPEYVLAASMSSLLLVGLIAQGFRAVGLARFVAPVVLALVLAISLCGMVMLQSSLAAGALGNMHVAADSYTVQETRRRADGV